jgi:hypothetical protein
VVVEALGDLVWQREEPSTDLGSKRSVIAYYSPMSNLSPPSFPSPSQDVVGEFEPPNRPGRKRLLGIILGLVVIAAGLGIYFFVVKGVPSNASKSTDNAFYIVLPTGWQYSAKGIGIGAVQSDFFAAKAPSAGSQFADNLNVIQTGTGPLSDIQSNFDTLKQQLTQSYGASNFSSLSNVPVSGESGISYTYELTLGRNHIKGEQIYCVHGGKDYVITLTTLQQDFDGTVSGDFQTMLNSWHWL